MPKQLGVKATALRGTLSPKGLGLLTALLKGQQRTQIRPPRDAGLCVAPPRFGGIISPTPSPCSLFITEYRYTLLLSWLLPPPPEGKVAMSTIVSENPHVSFHFPEFLFTGKSI